MIKLREHQLRIVDKMNRHQKGQVIVPTGGGKTICMISDAISQFSRPNKTIVVVSPRILLTQQLSKDFLELFCARFIPFFRWIAEGSSISGEQSSSALTSFGGLKLIF